MADNDSTDTPAVRSVMTRAVPDDVHRKAKARAAMERETLQSVMLAALTAYSRGE